jgi:DNA-binding beta-propeller fold protein YncE
MGKWVDTLTQIKGYLATMAGVDATARVIATGQTTLSDANQKALHAGAQVYKRLSIANSPNTPIGSPVFVGLTGVLTTTGFPLPDIGELVLMNVDINTIYVIGTSTDIVCWRGEV